ncbi:MAG: CAP domain-containing protein [Patescibacteria group bacterium]
MDFFRGLKNHFVPSHDNDYRPHMLRRAWLVALLAVVLLTEGFIVTHVLVRQVDQWAAVIQSQLISLTNDERAHNNLHAVIENPLLDAAAQAKAEDMAAKGYFSHNGPDGMLPWQWIRGVGYAYQTAGENLAVRFTDSSEVVRAWMESPTHRANIVKEKYTEIGIGVAVGIFEGERATYVVQFFATPKALAAANAPERAPRTVNASAPRAEVPATPTVAAAETSIPAPSISQSQTIMQTVERLFARTLANPSAASWVLGSIAALLMVALAITFFFHIQLQHGRMLMGGAMVSLFALGLLAFNSNFLLNSTSQTASIINASPAGGVVIDAQAYSILVEE